MRTGTLEERIERYQQSPAQNPALKEYEVWMEGYAATGERGTAHFVGTVRAPNFTEACHRIAYLKEWDDAAEGGLYNRENLSYWCCNLYPNEAEARRTFG